MRNTLSARALCAALGGAMLLTTSLARAQVRTPAFQWMGTWRLTVDAPRCRSLVRRASDERAGGFAGATDGEIPASKYWLASPHQCLSGGL
jgi:hypothetical protein